MQVPLGKVLFILANLNRALQLARYPNQGVGLMRMEFVINNTIRIHPMALVNFDKLENTAARAKIETLTAACSNKPEYFVN